MAKDPDREWIEAELRRIDERWQHGMTAAEALADERDKAVQEFKDTVRDRFVQINEFRGALDDLGKQMATRRELEATVQANHTERGALLEGLQHADATNAKDISELRSRIDSGPGQRGKEITTYAFSAAIIFVAIAGVIVALLSH